MSTRLRSLASSRPRRAIMSRRSARFWKLLVFPLSQVPEMARGKGVRLQRFKDGGLSDARVFALADGLTWRDLAGRTFTVGKTDLTEWIGNRAEAGRLPPKGFPRNNRF